MYFLCVCVCECVIAFTYIMTARHLVETSRSHIWGDTKSSTENTQKYCKGCGETFFLSAICLSRFLHYTICTKVQSKFSELYYRFFPFPKYKFQYMYLISTGFLLINSCVNPVALFCTSSPFRQHLKGYLSCFCKTNSPPNVLEVTRRNWICNLCLYFLQLQ